MASPDDPEAEARRLARSNAVVRVFGPGQEEEQADADALWWDRVPLDERAELVWQLSVEQFDLSRENVSREPGVCRPAPGPGRR